MPEWIRRARHPLAKEDAMLKQATSTDPVTAALYVYGVFDSSSDWSKFDEWIGDIQNSSFNVVIFSTFHVDADGNLFGNVPLVTNGVFNPTNQLNPNLATLYQGLAKAGKTLLYSIGNSYGTSNPNGGDMANLQAIFTPPLGAAFANLETNMIVLASQLALSGIDFDFEPQGENAYSTQQAELVAQFTRFCNSVGLGVTYCPYTQEPWWIQAQVLAGPGTAAWWNLQCYAGVTPDGWLPLIQQNATAMGVADPAAFIVAGAGTSQSPTATQQLFSQWAGAAPGLNGGFIWQFGQIESAELTDAYASAVVNGIQQATSVKGKRA
jgi:hypothetical protein